MEMSQQKRTSVPKDGMNIKTADYNFNNSLLLISFKEGNLSYLLNTENILAHSLRTLKHIFLTQSSSAGNEAILSRFLNLNNLPKFHYRKHLLKKKKQKKQLLERADQSAHLQNDIVYTYSNQKAASQLLRKTDKKSTGV